MDDIAYNPNAEQEERMKAWDREKKGLITDLQAERDKRQQLEQRLSSLETRFRPMDQGTPEEKVNRLAANPDDYIDERVKTHVSKLEERINQMTFATTVDRAYEWLADQQGTTPSKIKGTEFDREIARIIKDNNLNTIDPISGAKAAHKIYLQEKDEKEKSEKERSAAINGNMTERTGRVVASTGGFKFTAKQIAAMDQSEFNRRFDEIQEAKKNGQIKTN